MMKKNATSFFIALICCFIILFIDINLTRGYLEWLLYIIPILIIYKFEAVFFIGFLLFIIAVFLMVGLFQSPDIGTPFLINTTNRIEGFLTFVIFSMLVYRLNRAKKKIEKSNALLETKSHELADTIKELESFTYSVSHDLRSPIAIIKGFAGFLLEDYSSNLDDTGKDYLKLISNSTDKMNSLIEDLLRLSRVSQHQIHLEQVDLSKLAKSVIEEHYQLHPGKKIDISIKNDIVVLADPQLIRIALDNLLSNSIKYSSKKEKPLIELGVVRKDNRKLFFIRDNGAGFDMKKAEKLFEPFTRFHSEQEFGGTGIGLSIVQRIIKRHGGNIWAESEIGKGATFYFTLPSLSSNGREP